MFRSYRAGVLALALTLLLSLTLNAPTRAQDPDCWLPIYDTVEVEMFGQTVTKQEKVDEYFDPNCIVDDGRLNHLDAAAPATIYCLPDGGVAIWDLNLMSAGELALAVAPGEIAAVPTHPAENTLIAGAGGIRLYRLTTGQLQVNAPPNYSTEPEYVFVWSGCE